MSEEEPPTKKQKAIEEWSNHTMNIEEAIMKVDEGKHLKDIASMDLQVLQGIGPKADIVLDAMGLKTVEDLAKYKYFLLARAIATLATTEGKRVTGSVMNIDKAVDKEYETKSLNELLDAPLSALEGLTTKADTLLGELGVKTINDLANFKYAKNAEAIIELAKYEELKTKEERRLEKEMNKLA